ncbi:MAG: acetyl-CoA carboxylase biotin carboxyl carrier protein subunit [Acidobacteriota bacterium]
MLTLRGTYKGEAYEIEVSLTSGSRSEYECRVTRGNGPQKRFRVEIISRIASRWTLRINGKVQDLIISQYDSQLLIDWNNRNYRLSIANPKDIHALPGADHPIDQSFIRAEMTGKVVTISKKAGEPVAAKEPLATIEAMKMLNQVKSPKAGTVKHCHIGPGSIVKPGDLLFEIE